MVVPVEVAWVEGATRLARRLRESIYRLGRSVDADSPLALARWARLMRAGAAAERRIGGGPDAGIPVPESGVNRV